MVIIWGKIRLLLSLICFSRFFLQFLSPEFVPVRLQLNYRIIHFKLKFYFIQWWWQNWPGWNHFSILLDSCKLWPNQLFWNRKQCFIRYCKTHKHDIRIQWESINDNKKSAMFIFDFYNDCYIFINAWNKNKQQKTIVVRKIWLNHLKIITVIAALQGRHRTLVKNFTNKERNIQIQQWEHDSSPPPKKCFF